VTTKLWTVASGRHVAFLSVSVPVNGYLANGDIASAYRAAADSLPDAHVFVKPRIGAQSILSTPNVSANATVQLIAAVLAAEGR
jgi:hypothetical protein